MSLDTVYQEIILRHYRHPQHRGELGAPASVVSKYNPFCGDEITLQVRVREGRIEAVRFLGQGCAISQASAELMSRALEGKSLEEADALAERFTRMLHGDEAAAADRSLGELRALSGVAKLPVRVKCALLAWDALRSVREEAAG